MEVTSIEGIDKGPGRLGCLNGSGAGGGWILILVDGADMCSPGAPADGPEPIVVVGAATLVVGAVAETL